MKILPSFTFINMNQCIKALANISFFSHFQPPIYKGWLRQEDVGQVIWELGGKGLLCFFVYFIYTQPSH